MNAPDPRTARREPASAVTGARAVSAAAFAVSGALVGGLWATGLSVLFSAPGLLQIPIPGPLDMLARIAAGAGLFAVPWAVVGSGFGPALGRAARRRTAVGLGIAAAVTLTLVGVALPLLVVGEDVSSAWLPVGAAVALGFSPFGIASALWTWRRLHRPEAP